MKYELVYLYITHIIISIFTFLYISAAISTRIIQFLFTNKVNTKWTKVVVLGRFAYVLTFCRNVPLFQRFSSVAVSYSIADWLHCRFWLSCLSKVITEKLQSAPNWIFNGSSIMHDADHTVRTPFCLNNFWQNPVVRVYLREHYTSIDNKIIEVDIRITISKPVKGGQQLIMIPSDRSIFIVCRII